MRCPNCGYVAEPVRGRCLSAAGMRIDGHNAYIRVVDGLVRHCHHCGFREAGYDVAGVYMPDDDLYPLNLALLEMQQDQGEDRGPRHEPGS